MQGLVKLLRASQLLIGIHVTPTLQTFPFAARDKRFNAARLTPKARQLGAALPIGRRGCLSGAASGGSGVGDGGVAVHRTSESPLETAF